MIPDMKPPTCAHQATPPTSPGLPSERVPLKICASTQNPRKVTAGSSKKNGKNRIGTSTIMRAKGKRKKYAPITPAIAPEAPTVGTVELGLVNQCTTPAASPHSI